MRTHRKLFDNWWNQSGPLPIISNGARPVNPYASLLSGLIAVLKLSEVSGTRVDSVSGLDLVEGNPGFSTASVTGLDGQSAAWVQNHGGDGSFLKRSGSAVLFSPPGDFTFSVINSLGSTNPLHLISKNGNASPNQEYDIFYNNATGHLAFKLFHNGGATFDIIEPTGGDNVAGVPYLTIGWYIKSTGELGIRVNSTENTKTTTAVPVAGSGPFNIGAFNNAKSVSQNGLIQHVYYWNRALTPTERAWLYNSGNFLLYPFTETMRHDRLFTFDGDSLTLGTYPMQLMGQYGRIQPSSNKAVSGQRMDQILARAAATYAMYDANYARNILCIIAGTNSLKAGYTPAETHTDLATYCAGARAAGFKVIVGTIPNSTNVTFPAGYDTARQAYNALILANYGSYADGVADIGADATIGQTASPNNTEYFQSDKIHPVATGYAIFSNLFKSAIDAIP